MKEPVDHIERPTLPWRAGPLITECGLNAASVKTLTRSEFQKRLKEYGQQRTALLTCMTCSSTAARWRTWDEDPREAISREVEWEGRWSRDKHGHQLRDELRAIALLIERHREEFDETVKQVAATVDFFAEKEKTRFIS